MRSNFKNNNFIELEIGAGRPDFIIKRAIVFPNVNFVCVEVKECLIKKLNSRASKENLKNVIAIFGNAWFVVRDLFNYRSLSNIFLNFPDPWLKRKHNERQILNERFIMVLSARLDIGGCIFIKTDVFSLFSLYICLLKKNLLLAEVSSVPKFKEKNPIEKSHRECLCEEFGLRIYTAVFIRVS